MTWLRQHKTGTQMAFTRAYFSSLYQLTVFPPQLHTILAGKVASSLLCPMGPQNYAFRKYTATL